MTAWPSSAGLAYLEEQIGSRARWTEVSPDWAIRRGETLRCDDAESDSRVELDLCHAFRVVSTICVRSGVAMKP